MSAFTYCIILLFLLVYCKSTNINLVYYPNDSNEKYIENLISEFNEYSEKK
jgi:hypothetical protein